MDRQYTEADFTKLYRDSAIGFAILAIIAALLALYLYTCEDCNYTFQVIIVVLALYKAADYYLRYKSSLANREAT